MARVAESVQKYVLENARNKAGELMNKIGTALMSGTDFTEQEAQDCAMLTGEVKALTELGQKFGWIPKNEADQVGLRTNLTKLSK